MSSGDADLDAASRDDIADLEAFEARFPAEAFEDIARALGVSADRPNLEVLRELLREDLYWFCSTRVGDKGVRAKHARELKTRARAAATLLSFLRSGSVLDQPRVLLGGPFREKFLGVLEALARPPRPGGRYRRNDRFRNELAPSLIWIYEHATGDTAKVPHWLPDSRAYGGKFYCFACAVRQCLYDRAPEARAILPESDGALAQELQGHWPRSD
jgi:hypothetical protein